MNKKTGPVEGVPVAIRRQDGRTIYEVAFPRPWLSPFTPEAGASMRWSLIVNNSDGKGRTGRLQLSPGIGDNQGPDHYVDMVLIR